MPFQLVTVGGIASQVWVTNEISEVTTTLETTYTTTANLVAQLDPTFVKHTELTAADYATEEYVDTAVAGVEAGEVDLSAYTPTADLVVTLDPTFVTNAELVTALAPYVQAATLTSTLADYVLDADLATALAGYVETGDLTTALAGYVTDSELAGFDYATEAYVNGAVEAATGVDMGAYTQTVDLVTVLDPTFVKDTDLTTALTGYITSAALTTALEGYTTDEELTTALIDYATNANVDSAITTYLLDYTTTAELTTLLEGYIGVEYIGAFNTAIGDQIAEHDSLPAAGVHTAAGFATETYVDDAVAAMEGGGSVEEVFVGTSDPGGTYDLWYDTTIGNLKVRSGGSWVLAGTAGPQGPPGGLTGGVFAFTFSNTTTAGATAGQMRFNNATQNASTFVYISETDTDGLDVTLGLGRIQGGWKLYIQDFDNSANRIVFNVGAAGTDNGTYWSFPVSLDTASATSPIPTGKTALQYITPGTPTIPAGGTTGQALRKTSGVDYATSWQTDPLESRLISSGNGLTGGGNLSANRTLEVGAGTGISVSADAVAVDTTTIATKTYVDDEISGVTAGAGNLPTGGTVRQSLTKSSSTSYDAAWTMIAGAMLFTIAASNAPLAIRKRADYVCTGINDNATVNTAIMANTGELANRYDGGSYDQKYGSVLLSEGNFSFSGPAMVQCRGQMISGIGPGTVVMKQGGTFTTTGAHGDPGLIMYADTIPAHDANNIVIRDMYLVCLNGGGGYINGVSMHQITNSDGVRIGTDEPPVFGTIHNGAGWGSEAELGYPVALTDQDGANQIWHVQVHNCETGISIGQGGDGRGWQVIGCEVFTARYGFDVEVSDSRFLACGVIGDRGTSPIGFYVRGGNTIISHTKVSYFENTGSTAYMCTSGRPTLTNCEAQDCYDGFVVSADDANLSNCRFDTKENARYGFNFSGATRFIATGLNVHTRTTGITIQTGINLPSSDEGYITAVVGQQGVTTQVAVGGSAATAMPSGVEGTIVREGTTALKPIVTNSRLATMVNNRIKGNVSGGTTNPIDLTPAQVRTMIASDSAGTATLYLSADGTFSTPAGGGGGGGLVDGDMGDITVGGTGTTLTIDAGVVTYAKIQNVSATDRLLGRSTAGAGSVEEIICTAAARALLDDVDAAAMRTTLGVPTFSGTAKITVGTVQPTVGVSVGDIWVDTN